MSRTEFKPFFFNIVLFISPFFGIQCFESNNSVVKEGVDLLDFHVEFLDVTHVHAFWEVLSNESLTFYLHVSLIDTANTKVGANAIKKVNYQVKSEPFRENYDFLFPNVFYEATFYEIGINVSCKTVCYYSKMYNITIPPVKPILRKPKIYILDKGICSFRIDLAKSNITTENSYLYVIVKDLLDEKNSIKQTTKFAKELLKVIRSSVEAKRLWISHEEEIINDFSEMIVKVGDNSSELTNYIGTTFNPQLRNSVCDYEFNFVIYSKFIDKEVFSDVKRIVSNDVFFCPSSRLKIADNNGPDFNSFFILGGLITLIIIIIILFVYLRRIKKKRNSLSKIENSFIMKIKSNSNLSPIPEDSAGEEEHFFGNNEPPKRILSVKELDVFLRTYDVKGNPLEDEHSAIPLNRNTAIFKGDDKERNRYLNVPVYDFNRIRLNEIKSDYINASKISGFSLGIKYIATQGPLKETVDHFWNMLWQEKVTIIVMLTHLEENGVSKCELYWPEKDTVSHDGITIHAESTRVTTIFTERIFKVKKKRETRKVTHIHFHDWFDNLIPKIPHDFVDFLKYFRSILNDQLYPGNPVIVHCSAGLNRTGTFILCDYTIDMAEKEGNVNFPEVLYKLRSERASMLNNFKQYLFSHCVVNEFFNQKERSFPKSKFLKNFESLIETSSDDLNIVVSSGYWCSLLCNKTTNQGFYNNISKHRIAKPVLTCESFLYLKPYPPEDNTSIYINAVKIKNFFCSGRDFICTQQPLFNTMGDFWRLIDLDDINLIISLHDIEDNNVITPKFWPNTLGATMSPVDYLSVKTMDCTQNLGYYIVQLEIKNLEKNTLRIIDLIQLTSWTKDSFPKVTTFTSFLVDYLKRFKKRRPLFACYDGAIGCGVLLSLLGVFEKFRKDCVFDLVSVVRQVRRFRDDFMDDQKSYRFIYEVTKRTITIYSALIFKENDHKVMYENLSLKNSDYDNK